MPYQNFLAEMCSVIVHLHLNRQADETSNRLDLCLVTSKVDYTVPFDVNASFAEAFEIYLENAKN